MEKLRIGCHLSTSGGYAQMGNDAVSINANTFAFFTRNPRGGAAKEIEAEDVDKFIAIAKANDIKNLVAHAPYTLNPCSSTDSTREYAKEMMLDDMKRMEYTPGNYYNFHPGSHTGQGLEIGIHEIVELLDEVLPNAKNTTVLLETMAGKGSEVGGRFEELAEIIRRVKNNSNLGVCMDTCHIWDAGYDLHDLDKVFHEFDDVVGLERLKAIHINDSKNPIGAHKDRHEKIGQGYIGLDILSNVINHEATRGIPFILETPNELDGYKQEIELLRNKYKG